MLYVICEHYTILYKGIEHPMDFGTGVGGVKRCEYCPLSTPDLRVHVPSLRGSHDPVPPVAAM